MLCFNTQFDSSKRLHELDPYMHSYIMKKNKKEEYDCVDLYFINILLTSSFYISLEGIAGILD